MLGGIASKKVNSDAQGTPGFSLDDVSGCRASTVRTEDELLTVVDKINGRIAGLGASVTQRPMFEQLPQDVGDAEKQAGVATTEFRGITVHVGRLFVAQYAHSDTGGRAARAPLHQGLAGGDGCEV